MKMFRCLMVLLAACASRAAVVRIEIKDRATVGNYERVTGRAWFAVDPALPVNRVAASGEWLESVDVDLSLDARRLLVDIPMGFTDMLARDHELALAWRICTRAIFTTYFDRGYRAVDFLLDRPARKGTYLLTRN